MKSVWLLKFRHIDDPINHTKRFIGLVTRHFDDSDKEDEKLALEDLKTDMDKDGLTAKELIWAKKKTIEELTNHK